MKNLNAKQIEKALECCISGDDCTICPLCDEQSCPCVLNENALALITSQEQKIKELTEENERLEQHRKILEAKNERSEIICNSYALQYGTVADKEVFLKEERADTVRKMQERLKAEKFTHKNFGELVYVDDIDQIAKEMLEGANE